MLSSLILNTASKKDKVLLKSRSFFVETLLIVSSMLWPFSVSTQIGVFRLKYYNNFRIRDNSSLSAPGKAPALCHLHSYYHMLDVSWLRLHLNIIYVRIEIRFHHKICDWIMSLGNANWTELTGINQWKIYMSKIILKKDIGLNSRSERNNAKN